MSVKKFLSGCWYKLKQNRVKYVKSILCGVELITHKGTIRSKTDQDDAWFFELAKHHDCIFDIGANIGYTALLAMIQNPDRDYVLVDPNPKALALANENLLNNNLGFRARYFSAFVSDSLGDSIKFYTIGTGAAGSIYPDHAKSASSINAFTMVKTITLDYLKDYYKLSPDLIKIDVEGAEAMVIQGAINVTKQFAPSFFIEMHAVASLTMEQNAQKILNWYTKLNYNAWYLKEGELLIDASSIKHRGKCHLLLLPKDKVFPKYLIDIKQGADLPNTL